MGAQLHQLFTPNSNEQTDCCRCGVSFTSPVIAFRRNDGKGFYCPNGHPLTFGASQLDKVEKELERVKQERDRAKRDAEWAEANAKNARKAAAAELTKRKNLEKRTRAGTCPDCNRTFKQLAAHMKTVHGTPEERAHAAHEQAALNA